MTTEKTGLELLRKEFPPNQISKLPKETKAQADERKTDRDSAINCTVCGGWHHKRAVHLDYVGHAALTDRLLDADPSWTWEPLAVGADGLPQFDRSGGLWIRLTVCGVSRLGYGNASEKSHMDVGAREKEVIGDALRNAAMRFGAALDLWHKGQLHADDDEDETPAPKPEPPAVNLAIGAPSTKGYYFITDYKKDGAFHTAHVLKYDDMGGAVRVKTKLAAVGKQLAQVADGKTECAVDLTPAGKGEAWLNSVKSRVMAEAENMVQPIPLENAEMVPLKDLPF